MELTSGIVSMWLVAIVLYLKPLIAVNDCAVTHALVEFIDEKRPGVVPLHRIKEKEFQAGDQVTIVWTDRKQYVATIKLSGN